MAAPPVVAISAGDPCGVGPEVTVAALADPRVRAALVARVCGDAGALAQAAAARGLAWDAGAVLATPPLPPDERVPGRAGARAGAAALAALEAAHGEVLAGRAQALCTAPLSKERTARALPGFQGHTEWLAARSGVETVMMMAGPRLRVALATNHLALARVPAALTAERIAFVVRLVARELRERFAIAAPRIAVCGLNPHAGDGGLFGDEDARLVAPGVAAARAAGIDARGPLAADGLFPRAIAGEADAVIALYHDQGLIPAKLLDFRETVNVTLGLPFPRTSPDHGTADDIAGRGVADPEPMVSALLLAARLARRA